MKINQAAVAGTLESGDVMIRIAPLDTQEIDLQINSSVEKQFGEAIRATILDVLAQYDVRGVQLNVDDKGLSPAPMPQWSATRLSIRQMP